MSDLIGELKEFLIKTFLDVQFQIDIACQSIISKKKNEGIDCKELEHRYIHEFIASLKLIEDASMDELNEFIEREEGNLELLTRDEIFLKAGCKSVVYVEFDYIRYQKRDEFAIGAFLHSTFWLNSNQANYVILTSDRFQTIVLRDLSIWKY